MHAHAGHGPNATVRTALECSDITGSPDWPQGFSNASAAGLLKADCADYPQGEAIHFAFSVGRALEIISGAPTPVAVWRAGKGRQKLDPVELSLTPH